MDKETRNKIQRATQDARRLLEAEYAEQLEGTYDILPDGTMAPEPGSHLSPAERLLRARLVAAIEHKRARGRTAAEAGNAYLREAAFTTLNRFVALKMLEARELVQQCISRGEQSSGFKEFSGLAPGLAALPDHGYRLYIESLFDEIGREVRVLFDRRDPASLLWPRRQALLDLLDVLNREEIVEVWGEDETIGWVYQYFNGENERRAMREQSQAPRNSRELAVRNQFFTPRYVVQFLTDNTLGRTWVQMRGGDTALKDLDYLVTEQAEGSRPKKDPRDLKILDPACGSGHFLLYAFDLLLTIYEEGWQDRDAPQSEVTGTALRDDYPELDALRRAVPGLILRHNLHGIDIDPRAAQVAALALWMRAQRAYADFGVPRGKRPPVGRTNIVVAEPMPGDAELRRELLDALDPSTAKVVDAVFKKMELAGELGSLLKIEEEIQDAIQEAYGSSGDLFRKTDEETWREAEAQVLPALQSVAEGSGYGGRLFAGDAARGFAFIDLCGKKYDVVLMNPPFGSGSTMAKKVFEAAYPRTKNDVYAAFVERGIQLLHPRAMLGAITSRTGFFLSSFQKWREEIILKEAPPVVFADLGHGVMDAAMVEAAAYCLEVI